MDDVVDNEVYRYEVEEEGKAKLTSG